MTTKGTLFSGLAFFGIKTRACIDSFVAPSIDGGLMDTISKFMGGTNFGWTGENEVDEMEENADTSFAFVAIMTPLSLSADDNKLSLSISQMRAG